jgi:hypothetical protein
MSNPDDVAERLSGAVDDAVTAGFGHGAADRQPAEVSADWSVDDEPDVEQAMPLPTIVLATERDSDTEPGPGDHAGAAPVLPPSARVAPAVTPTAPALATTPVAGWGEYVTTAPNAPAGASLRAPGRRPRVRRVTRVLRHIDPWSTFKVALLFSLVGYVVTLTSGVLLWRVADSTGTLDNVERWFTQFGWETFELKGGEVFHNAWVIGLFGAIALTGGLVLLATLFNLVSDIVGGVRLTVLEEEVVERTVSSTRRYVVRRPPIGGVAPGQAVVPEWTVEGDGADSVHSAGSAGSEGGDAVADWSVDDA